MSSEVYDVTIIGGGPVGLYATFYAGMRELKTKIIEATPQLGGQLIMLYPEKPIYDVPGFPVIKAKDLIKNLVEQAMRFKPMVVLEERVLQYEKIDDYFVLITDKSRKHFTRTVIISAGIGAFNPNTLDRPGVKEFEGRGVYYYARDFNEFKEKRVLVVGGGDSALDWALHLYPVAKSVTLIHRRKGFRAYEKSVEALFKSPVTVKLHWELKEIRGGNTVEEVVIFNNLTGEEETLQVDVVILALGYKANIGPMEGWGYEMDGKHIRVNARMETSIPGIFACGDIVSVEGIGNIKLLATGFAQAAIAVGSAKHFLDPMAKIFGGHSSEVVPKKK
jgi:thioredoxin reductase (NADPH)